MPEPFNQEHSARLTAAARRLHVDAEFAARFQSDAGAALAELNFTAAQASRVQLEPPNRATDSCSCFGSIGRGCLVVDQPGVWG